MWRTATIDTAHRNGILVRLFGDGGCRGGEKSLSSHGRIIKQDMATEEAFFAGKQVAWGLYEALKKELVWRYPEMEIRVAKTQVSFFDRLMFGCVSFTRVRRKADMPAHFLTLTLGLPEPVDSPRIAVKCEPYPGRWTHHIVISSPDEIDAELLAWIDRAHQFAQR